MVLSDRGCCDGMHNYTLRHIEAGTTATAAAVADNDAGTSDDESTWLF